MTPSEARTLQLHDIVTLLDDTSAEGEVIDITPTALHIKWIDGPVGVYFWGGTATQYIIKKEAQNENVCLA